MLNSHLTEWFGLPVEPAQLGMAYEPTAKVYRFEFTYDTEQDPQEILTEFLQQEGIEQTVAIILGNADEGGSDRTYEPFLNILESHKARLPKLRGLFLGDVEQEENEMSWIPQSDIAQALAIFPNLEELWSRGQTALAFTACEHSRLKKLVVATGGMPAEVLKGIAASTFPELEHLELWLGDSSYGWNGTVEDLRPLLENNPFPKLEYLALGNSEIQNDIAAAVADAPILDQLHTLDLSMGVLSDQGAEPLLNSSRIRNLNHLNLHRNYLSIGVAARFKALGISVDVEGQESPDRYDGEEDYYVAVGE